MQSINELMDILAEQFKWNKARLNCFANMLIGLFVVKTVNLFQLSQTINSKTKQDSRYKRVKRFFRHFTVDYMDVAKFLLRLFYEADVTEGIYLSMDRTNWKLGKKDINVLMLGFIYKGIAIPLYWSLLGKQGSSDSKERKELIEKFINTFGKDCIKGLLADREFVGKEWFMYLEQQKIPFYIRVKNNLITTNSKGLPIDIHALFYGLCVHEKSVLKGKRSLYGCKVFLAASRSHNGELMIIATNQHPDDAIEAYQKRWGIETLFECLKTRGFYFEDTHLVNKERIKKLLVLLSIGFAWAHKVGTWMNEIKPIPIKKHQRLAMSFFKYGFNIIRTAFFRLVDQQFKYIRKLFRFLTAENTFEIGCCEDLL